MIRISGLKVKQILTAKGMTVSQLAGKAIADRKTVYDVVNDETGERPRLDRVGQALADALCVNLPRILVDERTYDELSATSAQADVSPGATGSTAHSSSHRPGVLPPPPPLIVGRATALADLKSRLCVKRSTASPPIQALTAMRGWPGVGKTTVAAALAHDPEVASAFPDGVLWASLGQEPNVFGELATWGRALGAEGLVRVGMVREASKQVAALLVNRQMLLIVDDVWKVEHGVPFRVGGSRCATLFTSRVKSVAEALVATPAAVYVLDVLTDERALELLTELAPLVVVDHREDCLLLAREVEGLPLALQVAGRLLDAEARMGWSVHELITEIREQSILLETQAPPDCADLLSHTTPTVAALLRRSVDCLEPQDRECFSMLAPFAPKPAVFDVQAIAAVWRTEYPKATIRTLVARGLMEACGAGRFQVHALLITLARSLLSDGHSL